MCIINDLYIAYICNQCQEGSDNSISNLSMTDVKPILSVSMLGVASKSPRVSTALYTHQLIIIVLSLCFGAITLYFVQNYL